MMFDRRWYKLASDFGKQSELLFPTMEVEQFAAQNPELSMAGTQCDTLTAGMENLQLSSSSGIKEDCSKLPGKSTLVNLIHLLLKSIIFHCKVARSCILRDKSPQEMLREYYKRVNFPI